MADRHQLTRPVMRRGTHFHADQARRQLSAEADDFGPAQLAPDQHCATSGNGVNLKYILRQIQSDGETSCSIERLLDVDLQRPHHRTALLSAEVVHDITSNVIGLQKINHWHWSDLLNNELDQ